VFDFFFLALSKEMNHLKWFNFNNFTLMLGFFFLISSGRNRSGQICRSEFLHIQKDGICKNFLFLYNRNMKMMLTTLRIESQIECTQTLEVNTHALVLQRKDVSSFFA
jgi:hypothetical protein